MRVLILGAGGPAGVNACRALHEAGHEVYASDNNPLHRDWYREYADDVPGLGVDIDLVFAQPDSVVLWLSRQREEGLKMQTFLPSHSTIQVCQDKLETATRWYFSGLRRDRPVKIEEPWPDWLNIAKDEFGLPFWLRARQGAGAKGAIRVSDLREAYHWLRFWSFRGADGWLAQEHLPGRDFAWSSIWKDGELVTSFARERLEYLYPHLSPEGLTGTPTVARIVHDPRVNSVAEMAVRAATAKPHGIMSVDLREDSRGTPRPTEINAGRGFTTFGLWSLYGPNFMAAAVDTAFGIDVDLPKYNALPEGLTLSRHIDCGHVFSEVKVPA